MRVAIVRRLPKTSFSMDVYADGLVGGLKVVRPNWEIIELIPKSYAPNYTNLWSKGLAKYWERYFHFPSIVKQQKVDIFHVIDHSDAHITYWLKSTGKPVAVTCHDLINFIHPENIQDGSRIDIVSSAAWKFSVRGLCQANHIITVSGHTAKDVREILHIEPERLKIVPNGVEHFFNSLPHSEVEVFRQQYQISPNTICLLNVGSNQPRKNVWTIIKVLATLKAQAVPIHLFKAGADFTQEQKTFIKTHNLDKCITYLGKPDKAKLVQIYNAADILLSPSLYEGFGITILEAMACGTPVITSNVSSLPEVAGNAAILVEPLDVEAIAEAVLRLHNDTSFRQQLIAQGLTRVKSFTWENTAEQIAAVYETLVGQGKNHKISDCAQPKYSLSSNEETL